MDFLTSQNCALLTGNILLIMIFYGTVRTLATTREVEEMPTLREARERRKKALIKQKSPPFRADLY